MLARTLGPKFSSFPCYVQPKLNGVRALYQMTNSVMDGIGGAGVFQSRDEKVWSPNVLDHLHKELYTIRQPIEGLILDGELYVHGWRLQDINAAIAVNRKEPSDKTKDVEFHVFDVVDPKKNFSERFINLFHSLTKANLPHIKAVPTWMSHSKPEMMSHFAFYTSLGYEGIMLRPNGPYEFGEHLGRGGTITSFRSKYLWKYKQWEDGEFECVEVTQGEGKANIGVGALVLKKEHTLGSKVLAYDVACYGDNSTTFKVGTGLTDSDRIDFMQNPPIGKLVKIRYLCLTTNGIPFNPSFLAVLS